jgi:hypothetical protein
MMIKRLFSTERTKRLFSEILKENSGTILALGVIGSGTFGIGLYVNQMRIYEEKLNAVRMEARKDTAIAEEKIKVSEEKIKVSEEKLNAVRIEARKDTAIAEEKINAVRIEARKDTVIAEERANNKALQLLYNIFTQEEYKEAKKKMLAQKSNNVNNE